MSFSEIAQLIAAIAFAIFVIACAIPLIKLGKSIDELTIGIRKISNEATETIELANGQLENVDVITRSASEIAQDASAMSTLLSSTVGKPLIKVAAFSYAVRKTMRINKDDK
ncbi:DUF948 domain-containing protein [Actinomyces sp. zg-332]|uniref:DUF948 domain-containing protein n=1 Tax=Actinomyces sp. zg-332 TaxID=2708340 RepID=UPI001421E60A|nr:DUF948 domain-containing protein [Actinomyces sp. zg-332]QPK94605.1 DUF948 domain-containing protein [Actinomyces sp. zg-332]